MSNIRKNKNYRPDIDGLRAISVISVIFYHFKIPFFEGGFVGVDIFFVISGYLITQNIISLIDNNEFNFSTFYFRRVRRLIPSLLTVILATFMVSLFVLSPEDMSSLSGSVVYAITGISNIYFWMQSGYFDSFASLKPLLHTWSLGVELQFYVLWPLMILLACRSYNRSSYRLFFLLLFIILSGSISLLYSFKETTSAFFLTTFRMHEFAIGAVVCFKKKSFPRSITSSLYYTLGLGLVLFSIFTFNINEIIFPGYMVFIPCVGAALMILSDGKSWPSRITNNKIASHIGEISYSLYLVHWPVFVLSSYVIVFTPSYSQTVMMLIATFLISYILYFSVEKRFRSPINSSMSDPSFSLSCTAFGMVISLVAASCWGANGWEWRVPEGIRNVNNIDKSMTRDYTWTLQRTLNAKHGFDKNDKRKKLLIIGDSQSADVINSLNESGSLEKYDVVARRVVNVCRTPYVKPENMDSYLWSMNKTTSSNPSYISLCKEEMKKVMDKELLMGADKIVVAMSYAPDLTSYVEEGLSEIRKNTEATLFVVGRKNLSKSSIDIINSFHRIIGINSYAAKFKDPTTTITNESIKKIKNIKYINMMDLVCPSINSCLVVNEENKPLFYDASHFTKYGAEYFGPELSKIID